MAKKPKLKPPESIQSKLDGLVSSILAKYESKPTYTNPIGLSNILLIKQIKLLEEIKELLCHTKTGQP